LSRTVDPFSQALSNVVTEVSDAELLATQVRAALSSVQSVVNDYNTANPTKPIAVPQSIDDVYFEIYEAIITAESLIGETGVTVGNLSDVVTLLADLDGTGE